MQNWRFTYLIPALLALTISVTCTSVSCAKDKNKVEADKPLPRQVLEQYNQAVTSFKAGDLQQALSGFK